MVVWGNQLAHVCLPTNDPMGGLIKLERTATVRRRSASEVGERQGLGYLRNDGEMDRPTFSLYAADAKRAPRMADPELPVSPSREQSDFRALRDHGTTTNTPPR